MAIDAQNSDTGSAADAPLRREAWREVMIVNARMRAALEQAALEAAVVPPSWFDLLVTLDGSPGRRQRLGELAEVVLLTRAGLSRLVDRVEATGLLRREVCPADKRGAYAVLTDAGADAVRRAWPVYLGEVDDRFGRHLPDPVALVAGLTAVLAANGWGAEHQLVQLGTPKPSSVAGPNPSPQSDEDPDAE